MRRRLCQECGRFAIVLLEWDGADHELCFSCHARTGQPLSSARTLCTAQGCAARPSYIVEETGFRVARHVLCRKHFDAFDGFCHRIFILPDHIERGFCDPNELDEQSGAPALRHDTITTGRVVIHQEDAA